MIVTTYITVHDFWKIRKDRIMSDYEYKEVRIGLVEKYIMPEIGRMKLSEIRLSDIESLFRKLRNHGMSNNSLRSMKSLLRRIFHEAAEEKLIKENPIDRLRSFPDTVSELHSFSLEDQVRLIRSFVFTKYSELYASSYFMGVPIYELITCKKKDYDANKRMLSVSKRIRSTKKIVDCVHREIFLSDYACGIIEKAMDKNCDSEFIFGDFDINEIYCDFDSDRKTIRNLTGLDHFNFPDLVSDYGIKAIDHGVNQKALMDHMGLKSEYNILRYITSNSDHCTNETLDEYFRSLQ